MNQPAIAVIGNPSSAASYAAGQDQAPSALRSAGLIEVLTASGRQVIDLGDLPVQVWRPDRDHPHAQNAHLVADNVTRLRGAVAAALRDGHCVLVLGGNCTVALAAAAAVRDVFGAPPNLLYFDRQYDLNTPQSTSDGALDWMGLAHALSIPGCVDSVVDALGPRPLLRIENVRWLGVDPELATPFEREQAAGLGAVVCDRDTLAADPVEAVRRAAGSLPDAALAVHLDVDVLDFTDAPLAENTDGRNTGVRLDDLAAGLEIAARRATVLSVGELNPTRSAGEPEVLARFVAALTSAAAQLVPAQWDG